VSDVLVVGAGIVGAAVARELAVRGVAVTLLDRGEVSSGTTGLGEGNVLLSDKDTGPELELARAGLEVYAEVYDPAGQLDVPGRKLATLNLHEWFGLKAILTKVGTNTTLTLVVTPPGRPQVVVYADAQLPLTTADAGTAAATAPSLCVGSFYSNASATGWKFAYDDVAFTAQ